MTGYGLTKKMRDARGRHKLSAIDQAVYMELIEACNASGWSDTFEAKSEDLCKGLRIAKTTLNRSRIALEQAGLLFFQTGNGRAVMTQYSFLAPFIKGSDDAPFSSEKGSEKGQQSKPFSADKGVTDATLSDLKGSEKGSYLKPFSDSTPIISNKTENNNTDDVDAGTQAHTGTHARTHTCEGDQPAAGKPQKPVPPKRTQTQPAQAAVSAYTLQSLGDLKAYALTNQEFLAWAFRNGYTAKSASGQIDVDLVRFEALLEQFNEHCRGRMKTSKTAIDYREHLCNWYPTRNNRNASSSYVAQSSSNTAQATAPASQTFADRFKRAGSAGGKD